MITRLNSPACTCRYRRFACALTGAGARLAVIVVRWTFDVELFHLLLHAGLSRRTYDTARPHRGLGQLAPAQADTRPPEPVNLAEYRIRRKQVLVGLTHEYHVAALPSPGRRGNAAHHPNRISEPHTVRPSTSTPRRRTLWTLSDDATLAPQGHPQNGGGQSGRGGGGRRSAGHGRRCAGP